MTRIQLFNLLIIITFVLSFKLTFIFLRLTGQLSGSSLVLFPFKINVLILKPSKVNDVTS